MAATISEIHQLALGMSEKERAQLAARLLESLPEVLRDNDDGVAEAHRRDAEIQETPSASISFAELDAVIKTRRE